MWGLYLGPFILGNDHILRWVSIEGTGGDYTILETISLP